MIFNIIKNINMSLVIDCAIIVLILSVLIAMFFKDRFKIIAIMIPLWTTISTVLYQLYTRVAISKNHEAIILLIEKLQKSDSTNEDFIKTATVYLEKLMEDDFYSSLTFIVSIFGIVLSVWVGLTIYNAVKKDELDKLIENVDNSNKLNVKVHVSNLYKTFDTNWTSSEYYLKEFPKINWSLLDSDVISNILLIENCFQRIVKYYDKNQYINILRLIPHGFELCNELEKTLKTNQVNLTVKGYYYQRKADFLYYQGMGEKYTGKYSKKSFEDSLAYYKKAIKHDSGINYHGYIDNTIGYLLYLLSKFEKKDDYLKQAEKYLIKACKEENYLYYKNLGCVYEAIGKVDFAEAYYRQSIKLNPNDYKSRICLASLLIKHLQKEMGISSQRTELLSEQTFHLKEEYKPLIEDIEKMLSVAEKIAPSMIDAYYKRGQLLTYCYLLGYKKSPDLFQQIKNSFTTSKELNTTFTAHLFHERNFYEAMDKIEKAYEINNLLLPEGDSEYILELYLSKLGDVRYD